MEASLLVLLFTVVVGHAPLPRPIREDLYANSVEDGPEVHWMLLPDDNGDVQVAILSGLEPRIAPGLDDVRFLLWTRENTVTAEQQVLNDSCTPRFRNFRSERQTKVLIHGFGDAAKDSLMFPLLKDAFLSHGDYNVVAVDWSKMAAAPWYQTAAHNTQLVARHTARLVDELVTSGGGLGLDGFHIVGFSLGAHVAGMVGQYVQTGRLRRITGLDPAQVLYTSVPTDLKLDAADAELVEVVHTSGGYLAFIDPLGHRDFFPNGGTWPQPGCTLDFIAVCSHRRAYYYLAEAIREPSGFSSVLCSDWLTFQNGGCDNDSTLHLWNDDASESAKGKYFLRTNSQEPFSMS